MSERLIAGSTAILTTKRSATLTTALTTALTTKLTKAVTSSIATTVTLVAILTFSAVVSAQPTDSETGLTIDNGWELVKTTCTRCHSADIVRQNSGNREVWKSRIMWMQETQGLEQLDQNTENTILDYLTKNYPQKQATRRPALATHLMPSNPLD